MTTIREGLAAAWSLVVDADHAGLPAPFGINVTDHSPTALLFGSLDKLTDWSLWLESPIGATVSDTEPGRVFHSVEADTEHGPVRLTFVELVAS